jgi:hypothetical protein
MVVCLWYFDCRCGRLCYLLGGLPHLADMADATLLYFLPNIHVGGQLLGCLRKSSPAGLADPTND